MIWGKVTCDLCGSNNLSPYLKNTTTWEHKGKFDYVKCLNCGLVFLNPRPTKEEIGQYYPAETYWGGQNIRKMSPLLLDEKWRKERDKRFKAFYQEIFKRFIGPAKILDIGCGTNGFLTAFSERGWQVLGTDFSQEAALYSQKTYGFKVLVGDLLEIDFGREKFDVISLNGVLEHLYSPRKTLEKVNKLFAKDGLLAIMVPNIESLGAKIFKDDWWLLQPPRHLYHFSPKTINLLFKKTGFRILSINHFNWIHNYYSLFESFRFKFSPRFRKDNQGGLREAASLPDLSLLSFLIKEAGKMVDIVFASMMAILGAVLKKGEQIAVYGEKT